MGESSAEREEVVWNQRRPNEWEMGMEDGC